MDYKELKKKLLKHYSLSATKKLLTLVMRPSYEKILMLNKLYGIPFEAWLDIRAWLNGFKDEVGTSKLDTICPKCKQAVKGLGHKLNEKIKDM